MKALTNIIRQAHIRLMQEPAHAKLARWMKANERPLQWLADKLGCSQPQASRICTGAGRTSPERAFMIEKLTRGTVKAADLLTGPLAANDQQSKAEAA